MKNRFIIFTHGNLGKGLLDTVEFFCGQNEKIKVLSLLKEDNIDEKEVEFENLIKDSDENLIVFTDLFGGSPNNLALKYKLKYNFSVISGVNLAILIDAVSNIDLSRDEIMNSINEIKDEVIKIF